MAHVLNGKMPGGGVKGRFVGKDPSLMSSVHCSGGVSYQAESLTCLDLHICCHMFLMMFI